MAEVASESWWIKLGVMYDKSGFRAAMFGMADLTRMAGSLADAFKRIVDTNSDLYRTAHNLNISTRDLQVWQRVFRMVGGTVEEARSDIDNLNYAYDQLRLGMGGQKAEFAARLHLRPEDLVDFETSMKALNRSFNTYFNGDIGLFKPLAQQLGLSERAIYLVTRPVNEYENIIKRVSNIPLIPEHQLRAADRLRQSFERLSIMWENFKASIMSASFPALSKLMQDIERVMNNPQVQKSVSRLLQLLEIKFNELVNGDNVAKFFTQLNDGINKIATNDNVDKFITTVGAIVKAVDYGIIKPIGVAAKGYGLIAEQAAELQTEHQQGGVDWRNRIAPIATGIVDAVPGGVAARGVTQIFNVVVREVKDARSFVQQLENEARKREVQLREQESVS